jgi:hypothetical protein
MIEPELTSFIGLSVVGATLVSTGLCTNEISALIKLEYVRLTITMIAATVPIGFMYDMVIFV